MEPNRKNIIGNLKKIYGDCGNDNPEGPTFGETEYIVVAIYQSALAIIAAIEANK